MTTRDIKIKVTGVQSVAGADDEPEVLELETRGTYSEKNGNRYIKYDEFIEEKNVNGWFIGFVESKNHTYFFATNIQAIDNATGSIASEITLSILSDMNIYKL